MTLTGCLGLKRDCFSKEKVTRLDHICLYMKKHPIHIKIRSIGSKDSILTSA